MPRIVAAFREGQRRYRQAKNAGRNPPGREPKIPTEEEAATRARALVAHPWCGECSEFQRALPGTGHPPQQCGCAPPGGLWRPKGKPDLMPWQR